MTIENGGIFGRYAAQYTGFGFAVFPCFERDKRPKTKNGCKDATTDTDKIKHWAERAPAANIGIATGAASGVWVLDIDGAEGAAWLEDAEQQHGPLPVTPEVRTGKGRHIYFRLPEGVDVQNSAGKICNQVDVRGTGGYVIAPPSIHPNGGIYAWDIERRPSKVPLAEAPAWLLDLAVRQEKKQTAPPQQTAPAERATAPPSSPDLTDKYVQRAYDGELRELMMAGQGGRNDRLNKAAFALGQLIGQGGLTEAQVRSGLQAACQANGLWAEEPDACLKTIESGIAGGASQPRTIPELRQTRQAKPKAKPAEQPRPALTVVEGGGEYADVLPAWRNRFIVKNDGEPKPKSIHNAILCLVHHHAMDGVLMHDTFADNVMIMKRPPWLRSDEPWHPRPIRDDDAVHATAWLEDEDRCGTALAPGTIYSCMITAAMERPFDPARDWLDAQEWDGERRLSGWLWKYCGAADNEYVHAVGRKFLLGAVARVMEPGFKVDTVPIFEGEQGLGKSSMLRTLGTWDGTSYFTDQLDDITNKDGVIQLNGFVIVEIAELDLLQKTEQSAIKKYITRQIDTYRPPYGKALKKQPRRCVFAGTVNPSGHGYLKDPTGARRFLPVRVGKIDIEGLSKIVPQLWAEAVVEYRSGFEKVWIDDADIQAMAAKEQEGRYEEDPWAAKIDAFIKGVSHVSGVGMDEIMDALGIPTERKSGMYARRISGHMRSRGWEYRQVRDERDKTKRVRKFFPPVTQAGLFNEERDE